MSESDIAAKMMAGMRAQLERDQADGKLAGLSVDELADAMAHPKAGEVIADCMRFEATSVKPGERAPDFTLPRLNSLGTVTLSDHFGKRPVALVFGSYT